MLCLVVDKQSACKADGCGSAGDRQRLHFTTVVATLLVGLVTSESSHLSLSGSRHVNTVPHFILGFLQCPTQMGD